MTTETGGAIFFLLLLLFFHVLIFVWILQPCFYMKKSKRLPFTKKDLGWTSVFVGNAIGSGILFLPIQAGISGFLVFFLVVVVGYPLIYFSQRFLINVLVKRQMDNLGLHFS